jgi:hypothetical protein
LARLLRILRACSGLQPSSVIISSSLNSSRSAEIQPKRDRRSTGGCRQPLAAPTKGKQGCACPPAPDTALCLKEATTSSGSSRSFSQSHTCDTVHSERVAPGIAQLGGVWRRSKGSF